MSDGDAGVILARGLGRDFDDAATGLSVAALSQVSLQVPRGAITALVGPDGAGKTTLLRLVAGLIRPSAGELQVLGLDVAASPQAVQDRISYMPQRFGLYEDLSVQENLDLYSDLHGVPAAERRERQARLLQMTDLARFTARPAGKLSGGMKQKLGLACTLVRSPQLLLLDEPTVGVDPLSRRELWTIVQELVAREQLSVLLATSYIDEAERCALVHVLHEGRLLASGTPAALTSRARGLCREVAPRAGEAPRLLQARLLDETPHVIDAVPRGGNVRFIQRVPGREPVALRGDRRVLPVEEHLEDAFMMLLDAGAVADVAAPPPGDEAADSLAPVVATDAPPTRQAPAAGEAPVIEVKELTRRFGDFVAVDRTSFSVARGEIFGLLGPNGAGKTTTFRMLCGLLPASGGQARVAGLDLRRARAAARRRIGYVAQKFSLYGHLTVDENLEFFAGAYGLHGASAAARIATVVRQFDLAAHLAQRAVQLPGGVKRRLAMAVALVHEPEILFLDEPTSGADPQSRRRFWRWITQLAAAGTTVVVTTHFMEEAEYCDRVAIQDGGRLLALGTPTEVRAQAGETAARRLDMEQAFIAIVEQARAAPGGERRHAS